MNLDLEQKILASFLQDRAAYERVRAVVAPTDFSEVGRIIFQAIESYYSKDETCVAVDQALLVSRIQRKYRKQAPAILEVLARLSTPVSITNTLDELLAQKKAIVESRLGNILMDPNRQSLLVRKHIDEWLNVEDLAESLSAVGPDVQDEIQAPAAEDFQESAIVRMPLFPGALNKLTGGIVKGMNMVVFGRPEVGKTGFTINMAVGWLKRGYRVCHIVNEEDIRIIFLHYLSRLKEQSFTLEALTDVNMCTPILKELAEPLSRLLIKRLNPGSERELETVIKEFQPDAMIVDQMLNLNEKSMEGLAKSSSMIRRLGGKHGVTMVAVTQADEAAAGKVILHDYNIYMSKTAVQGDADLLIGLGAGDDYVAMNKLHINVVKDKVPDGGHGHFPVTIDRAARKLISLK